MFSKLGRLMTFVIPAKAGIFLILDPRVKPEDDINGIILTSLSSFVEPQIDKYNNSDIIYTDLVRGDGNAPRSDFPK